MICAVGTWSAAIRPAGRRTGCVLAAAGGRKGEAARILGIGSNTLWRRLK